MRPSTCGSRTCSGRPFSSRIGSTIAYTPSMTSEIENGTGRPSTNRCPRTASIRSDESVLRPSAAPYTRPGLPLLDPGDLPALTAADRIHEKENR